MLPGSYGNSLKAQCPSVSILWVTAMFLGIKPLEAVTGLTEEKHWPLGIIKSSRLFLSILSRSQGLANRETHGRESQA